MVETPPTGSPLTDTPAVPASPPTRASERVKAFIGDLARPTALYVTTGGCTAALLTGKPADVLTVAFGALTLMYGAKAVESAVVGNAQAKAGTVTQ